MLVLSPRRPLHLKMSGELKWPNTYEMQKLIGDRRSTDSLDYHSVPVIYTKEKGQTLISLT